jgi:nucleoside-diphosphate kinase
MGNESSTEAQPQVVADRKVESVSVPIGGIAGTKHERTFIAIKPDGVQRGKIGNIVSRFEDKGFKLVAFKMIWPTKKLAEGHYEDLKTKKFFKGLCDYFSSGPVVAMVWEGLSAAKMGRVLLGATNPADSLPGTIRGDLCIDIGRNICHGSDSPESAAREIAFWFTPSEICNWNSCADQWIYEDDKCNGPVEGDDGKAITGKTAKISKFCEAGNRERTFIAIKPDAVQRGKIGNIIGRFEARGFKLVALRLLWPTNAQAAGHYDDLSSKPFFQGLCNYFSSGPVVTMAWEGKGAVLTGRALLGATNPADSLPGTIRGDLCIDIGRNVCHGSDSTESAEKELSFWFKKNDICDWGSHATDAAWIYE